MWMRMPQGSARRHGQSQADMCALHPISDIAASGPPNDEHDQARADSDGDDDEADGVGDLLDIASAGLSGDGMPDLDLQAELLEVLEADMQAHDIEDGEDEDVEDEDGNEPQAASSSVVEEPATAACHEAVVDQAVARLRKRRPIHRGLSSGSTANCPCQRQGTFALQANLSMGRSSAWWGFTPTGAPCSPIATSTRIVRLSAVWCFAQ